MAEDAVLGEVIQDRGARGLLSLQTGGGGWGAGSRVPVLGRGPALVCADDSGPLGPAPEPGLPAPSRPASQAGSPRRATESEDASRARQCRSGGSGSPAQLRAETTEDAARSLPPRGRGPAHACLRSSGSAPRPPGPLQPIAGLGGAAPLLGLPRSR